MLELGLRWWMKPMRGSLEGWVEEDVSEVRLLKVKVGLRRAVVWRRCENLRSHVVRDWGREVGLRLDWRFPEEEVRGRGLEVVLLVEFDGVLLVLGLRGRSRRPMNRCADAGERSFWNDSVWESLSDDKSSCSVS